MGVEPHCRYGGWRSTLEGLYSRVRATEGRVLGGWCLRKRMWCRRTRRRRIWVSETKSCSMSRCFESKALRGRSSNGGASLSRSLTWGGGLRPKGWGLLVVKRVKGSEDGRGATRVKRRKKRGLCLTVRQCTSRHRTSTE